MKAVQALLVALALITLAGTAAAESTRPYKDGPVTDVTFVRTKPGQFDAYMRFLAGSYKAQMEASQKAGLVIGYKVFVTEPRGPHDANVILTVTYPNMATLDKTDEFDAVSAKVAGPMEAQNKAYADRGSMREPLGSQLMRELILK